MFGFCNYVNKLRNNTSYHGDDGLDDKKLFVFFFFWLVTRSGRRSLDVKEELALEKVQDRQTKQELLWSICGAELLALLALLARPHSDTPGQV